MSRPVSVTTLALVGTLYGARVIVGIVWPPKHGKHSALPSPRLLVRCARGHVARYLPSQLRVVRPCNRMGCR
jgi:hypothetical protein